MAWARVDDGWWSHPKVMGLSLAARGLWITSLSWSCQHRRDEVPVALLGMVGADDEVVDELVDAGLWHPNGSDGWQIHDWAEYQELSLSEKRAAAGAKGGRRSGETRRDQAKREAPAKQAEASERSNSEANAEAGTQPDPTHPDPVENTVVEPSSTSPTSTELVLVEPPASGNPVAVVFEAWRDATGRTGAKLTADRRRRITRWLSEYPVEDLADACRGITRSAFHAGRNDRHTRYDGIEHALKSAQHIEQFRDLWRGAPDAAPAPAARARPRSADVIARLAHGGA